MVTIDELTEYTNRLLNAADFSDYCPNGLQVEGRREVRTLVSGVTASQAFLSAAADAGADAVLVHHGYFWKGERPVITGMKRRRIQTLLERQINLLAYHLPLDAHPELGNNAGLARTLSFHVDGIAGEGRAKGLLFHGRLSEPMSGGQLARHIEARLGRAPVWVDAPGRSIETIAWCTGGAQGFIEQALALQVDAYLSGEISEPTPHIARENGLHYFAAGHHATERYGPLKLGEHLAERFGLKHEFIDIDNPA